jgi:hypothetical protein
MSQSEFETGEGLRSTRPTVTPHPPSMLRIRSRCEASASNLRTAAECRLRTLSHKGRGERERTYTAAVVTPPSTTMVCPVMKLEASEPR